MITQQIYPENNKRKKIRPYHLIARKSRGLVSACLTGLLYAKYENICWIDPNLPDLAKKFLK